MWTTQVSHLQDRDPIVWGLTHCLCPKPPIPANSHTISWEREVVVPNPRQFHENPWKSEVLPQCQWPHLCHSPARSAGFLEEEKEEIEPLQPPELPKPRHDPYSTLSHSNPREITLPPFPWDEPMLKQPGALPASPKGGISAQLHPSPDFSGLSCGILAGKHFLSQEGSCQAHP